MNYLIFAIELIAIILWLWLGPHNWLAAVAGVIVIILISQLLHTLLHAR